MGQKEMWITAHDRRPFHGPPWRGHTKLARCYCSVGRPLNLSPGPSGAFLSDLPPTLRKRLDRGLARSLIAVRRRAVPRRISEHVIRRRRFQSPDKRESFALEDQ